MVLYECLYYCDDRWKHHTDQRDFLSKEVAATARLIFVWFVLINFQSSLFFYILFLRIIVTCCRSGGGGRVELSDGNQEPSPTLLIKYHTYKDFYGFLNSDKNFKSTYLASFSLCRFSCFNAHNTRRSNITIIEINQHGKLELK